MQVSIALIEARINRRHLDLTARSGLHNHVAGKHGSDLVFELQRFMGECRIACSEDTIRPKVHVDLLLECLLNVDFGNDAKALAFESLCRPLNDLIKVCREKLAEVVGHDGPDIIPEETRVVT